ncbi:MAG: Rrf2 family transcriptional regulator [Rhizonema sp. NSF051]|nr:Rrf2 family transcriptional regulator [Rhizonema sp. NSF051]
MNIHNYALLDLSSKVEYAVLALLELANHKGEKAPLTMNEITDKQPIPDRYLEQILASLRRAGLVKSQRGSRGGFVLAREPWQITLLEIVTLMEGERKEGEHVANTSPEKELIYEIWDEANAACTKVLKRYTLQDLCEQLEARRQQGPMYYI